MNVSTMNKHNPAQYTRLMITLIAVLCLTSSTVHADLVAHWSGEGTAADATGNGHDGTLVNGTTFASGVLGQAFSFDGVNDFVTVNANVDLEPTDFSIAMWIASTPNGGIQLLADSSHGSPNGPFGWAIQMDGSGKVGIAYGNGSGFPGLNSTSIVADGLFHHFAATIGGGEMRIYVDGILENSGAFAGTPMGTGLDIRFGRHFSLNRQYSGLLDEIRLYDNVLDASTIQGLANAVPEPSSFALLVTGGIGMLLRRKR